MVDLWTFSSGKESKKGIFIGLVHAPDIGGIIHFMSGHNLDRLDGVFIIWSVSTLYLLCLYSVPTYSLGFAFSHDIILLQILVIALTDPQ